jgi:hypothetical protein
LAILIAKHRCRGHHHRRPALDERPVAADGSDQERTFVSRR